jgi:hypothetical protein
MKTLSTALLSITVVALVGCATPTPREVPASAVQGIKRFGVVSVAGSEFTRQYVGVTVFGNELEVKDIRGWGLNKEYEDQLGAAAERALGTATYISGTYSTTDFMKVNDPNGPWDAPAFSGPNWDGIEAAAKAACQKDSLDALFVMTRRKSGDIFGGTNQRVIGVGAYSRRDRSLLHFLSVVGLVDCKTGKPLAERYITQTIDLPEELARTPIPQWRAESEESVREKLIKLPPVLWESTLRNLLP